MRVRLLVNPVASSMTDRRQQRVADRLGTGHDVDVVRTTGRGDARELAARAVADGVDVVVVAAGDGTLNEASDSLVGTATAVAAIPGGSTNVFARAVGYSNHLGHATEQLVAALDRDAVRRIGVGSANGRHFLFHLGTGFDAAVVARMERLTPKVKRFAAHPTFAVQTVRTVVRGFDRRIPALRVETLDGLHHDSFFTVVSNLSPYTFVGPRRMLLSHDAGLDRALAVTSLSRFTVGDVIAAFGSSVGRAEHLRRGRQVVQLRDLDHVRLTATRPGTPFPWQVDGDYLGTTDRLDVSYVPDALLVVLPV
ncbi:MAG: diacylglycerol/lipid kinase family protein [Actinomycetota bacterium]